jgi:hypothetical protein
MRPIARHPMEAWWQPYFISPVGGATVCAGAETATPAPEKVITNALSRIVLLLSGYCHIPFYIADLQAAGMFLCDVACVTAQCRGHASQ